MTSPRTRMLTECVEWAGARDARGYGRKWYRGQMRLAHRVAYCHANNMILEGIAGKVVRHKCDNPPCVNPDHLELGTVQDNVADRMARGRHRSGRLPGERHPAHVLSEADVMAIRKRYVKSSRAHGLPALARDYGVCVATVHEALRGKTWRHLCIPHRSQ